MLALQDFSKNLWKCVATDFGCARRSKARMWLFRYSTQVEITMTDFDKNVLHAILGAGKRAQKEFLENVDFTTFYSTTSGRV